MIANPSKALLGFALIAFGVPELLCGAELQPGTLKIWDDYIRSADLRMQARLDAERAFLWTDESTNRRQRLKAGEVVVAPLIGHGTKDVPDGLIHHWIGAVFIPNATVRRLLAVVYDYEAYKDFYKPVVTDSKTLACAGSDRAFSMIWQRKVLFLVAAVESQYQAREVVVDARRGYSFINATRVQEIQDYGHAGQRLLPSDTGNGLIWRLHSINRYEERDGGIYLEVEAFVLSRDIPSSLRWLVNPMVRRLSIDSLTTTLRQTREAVNSLVGEPDRLRTCPNSRPPDPLEPPRTSVVLARKHSAGSDSTGHR